MKISVVVDNVSSCNLGAEHGLSLFVETDKTKFFFDLGQSDLFSKNASAMNIDVSSAQFAVISHGHYDHGGGIEKFLELNTTAEIFINKNAFGNFYSQKEDGLKFIGLSKSARNSRQIRFVDDIYQLPDKMILFGGACGSECMPSSNRLLFAENDGSLISDSFNHEQSLVVEEGSNIVLIAGCAHSGILNIIKKAEEIINKPVTHVLSGFHLKGSDNSAEITLLAKRLKELNCKCYTCHCTGQEAYKKLKTVMGNNLEYAGCGRIICI